MSRNKVGPVLRPGELAQAIIDAIELDNPEREISIEDHVAYIRVQAEDECLIRRATVEECLGRPFKMQELETILGSFAGQIENTQDHMRFYFEKKI